LSSKPKKVEPEKATERPVRPPGKVPEAMVIARHGQGEVTRVGRGFSWGELSGASLSPRLALSWGVRLDSRRRSTLQKNVESLKGWAVHGREARKPERRAKELEEEVEKVAKVVKKEAVKAEKEVAKVEKEVKKEAVRAKKAVKRKTAKPKKKTKKKTES